MISICWSVKGGSGTTVVTAALASLGARSHDQSLIVDCAGDIPAALGIAEPVGPGLSEWLNADEGTSVDAIPFLCTDASNGIRVLPKGQGPIQECSRLSELVDSLIAQARPTFFDFGIGVPHQSIQEAALHSFLVIRPCYLALRKATAVAKYATGIILLSEAGRALTKHDVEQVLGIDVVAEIPVDPAIARSVDAGLLANRMPSLLGSRLSHVA